jgi:hypothetical protein
MNIKEKLAGLVGSKTGKLKKKHVKRAKVLARGSPKAGEVFDMGTLKETEVNKLLTQ